MLFRMKKECITEFYPWDFVVNNTHMKVTTYVECVLCVRG